MDFLRLLLVTAFAGLSACSLSSKDEDPSLYVDLSPLQDRSRSFSLLNSPSFLASAGLVAPPSSATGFSCYAVNVTGPGILDTSLHPDSDPLAEFNKTLTVPDYYCSYRGIVTPPLAVSTGPMEVALPIPPGAIRLVQVVGVNDATVCSSGVIGNEADNTSGSGSRYFEIGRSVVSDLYSDQSVNVNLSWPTGNTTDDGMARQKRAMDCGGGNCGSFTKIGIGVSPAPTPSPIASPASYVAQRLDNVPGTYIRRASIPLQAVNAAMNVTATIYQASVGSAPGGATSYASTVNLPVSASPTVVNFDFYQTNLGYLQMVAGTDYWIVLSWTPAAGDILRISHVYNVGSSYTGLRYSFDGSNWTTAISSDGMVIDAYGCAR